MHGAQVNTLHENEAICGGGGGGGGGGGEARRKKGSGENGRGEKWEVQRSSSKRKVRA